ncbi:cytochrome P450 [Kutzneria buriramensis]|uniref:Nocardicin N-oxygenase n=1 Tax=Kutzneria buriramensis TaxID=1045776 RepID=A0A3E0HEQ3_9PSEU|nr:cytochrome P450 [Kutzneria buriramensis]REH43751.1 nocardicin N-oxygenase [Kutzneria buriramensis]
MEGLRYPLAPAVGWRPAEQFLRLRQEEPVVRVNLPSGDEGWLVTRYEDNKALLADPRFSRALAARARAPRARLASLEQDAVTTTDPPQHTRLRRLAVSAFTTGRVTALSPVIRGFIADGIDELVKSGTAGDLVQHVSEPVPMRVICALLGLPSADHDWFRDRARTYLSAGAHGAADVERAGAELRWYLGDAVAERRLHPGEDLLSGLVAAGDDDKLTDGEIVAFGVTLLMAGYSPTSHQIAGSVFALLHEPSNWQRLTAELLPTAVEELLRYCPMPASGGTVRIATEDVSLGGVLIRAGEAVLPALVSANRDETVFADADRLVIDRADNPHVAFGHGIHRCLGAQLARAELRLTLEALRERLPGLRLAVPAAEIRWQLGGMQRGPAELPVTW